MRKKLFIILMAGAISLSFNACGNESRNTSTSQASTSSSTEETGLKADKNLLSVEVTIPANLIGDNETALTEESKEAGIKEITKNDDGSITMKMTKDAHRKLLDDLKSSVDDTINEMVTDKENYPSYDSITYNDDLTEFDVNVDSSIYGGFDSLAAAFTFYLQGNIYQSLNAVSSDKIKTIVNFIDKDTGDIIESGDSSALNSDASE